MLDRWVSLSLVGLVAASLASFACAVDPEPYVLTLQVARAEVCDAYEEPVIAAITLWADHGVEAFVYGGCDTATFDVSPTIRELPEYRPYTTDLPGWGADHVPVYVVDRIVSDIGGYRRVTYGGVGLEGEVWCPWLVALTTNSLGLVAHELGHQVILDHDASPDNVMHHAQHGEHPVILREQADRANRNFRRCRG